MDYVLVKKDDNSLYFVEPFWFCECYVLPNSNCFLTTADKDDLCAWETYLNESNDSQMNFYSWLAEFHPERSCNFLGDKYLIEYTLKDDISAYPNYFNPATKELLPAEQLLSCPVRMIYGPRQMANVYEQFPVEIIAEKEDVSECVELGANYRDGVTVMEAKGNKYVVVQDMDRCVLKVLRPLEEC